jgi:hypothetical protein
MSAEQRRLKAERQARWRANRKLADQLGLPSPNAWRAELNREYPIPFGWTITVARAWAQSSDPQPTTQAEADAWRKAWETRRG